MTLVWVEHASSIAEKINLVPLEKMFLAYEYSKKKILKFSAIFQSIQPHIKPYTLFHFVLHFVPQHVWIDYINLRDGFFHENIPKQQNKGQRKDVSKWHPTQF